MSFATDDLAPLLTPGRDQGLKFGQGVVITWNTETGENTISFRGSSLTNLPLLNTTDGLTMATGDVVGILSTGTSHFVLGRIQNPPVPESAAEFLRSAIAREIAAETFVDRITTATIATEQSRTTTTFGDLATVGPSVQADVQTGAVIVEVGARIWCIAPGLLAGGMMSFAATGPTAITAPSLSRSLEIGGQDSIAAAMNRAFYITGLAAGTYTFTAKYRTENSGMETFFSDRYLSVTAF